MNGHVILMEQNMMAIFQTHNQDGIFIWAKHGVDTTNRKPIIQKWARHMGKI